MTDVDDEENKGMTDLRIEKGRRRGVNDSVHPLHGLVEGVGGVEISDDDKGELLLELRPAFTEIGFLLRSSNRSSNVESLRESFVRDRRADVPRDAGNEDCLSGHPFVVVSGRI